MTSVILRRCDLYRVLDLKEAEHKAQLEMQKATEQEKAKLMSELGRLPSYRDTHIQYSNDSNLDSKLQCSLSFRNTHVSAPSPCCRCPC